MGFLSIVSIVGQQGYPDAILASTFGHFDFQLESIERLRKRQRKRGI